MIENSVEEIFDAMLDICPSNWERLALHADADDTHTEMYFYVKCGGRYYTSEEAAMLCGVSLDELTDAYRNIILLCEKPEEAEWLGFDLVIDGDGSFEINYNYAPIDDTEWEKKYLV